MATSIDEYVLAAKKISSMAELLDNEKKVLVKLRKQLSSTDRELLGIGVENGAADDTTERTRATKEEMADDEKAILIALTSEWMSKADILSRAPNFPVKRFNSTIKRLKLGKKILDKGEKKNAKYKKA